ncbi:SixA phosphatase family protein [Aquiflexum gelatinilyticum]|uniref:Histidine phosphatase family protein n=1 Tax=Aquiflexum gelatinilyticum TaxID=2961943 RepID=A0A9X2T202_9BACT|nr:histidine phosphatase family protein [Aquiflexum gelatinilyticum]MCR9017358.1 histidine phosphatase family protein [Aquiflexum gelatinilyticum]
MKSLFTLLIVSLLFLSCSPKQEPKTVYIVRHAEKILEGDDPGLSVAGTARSKKLAQILGQKEIQHIFSTNTIRTKTTAQPLADAVGLTIEIYDPKNHDDLVKELRQRTGNILVVGHSNTINHLANYFVGSGEKYPELQDIEYDFIFEVSLKEDGSTVERKVFKDY